MPGSPNWLVASTRLGRAIRAVAENPKAARVLGINVQRVTLVTFMLSSALAAPAGILFALAFNSIRIPAPTRASVTSTTTSTTDVA